MDWNKVSSDHIATYCDYLHEHLPVISMSSPSVVTLCVRVIPVSLAHFVYDYYSVLKKVLTFISLITKLTNILFLVGTLMHALFVRLLHSGLRFGVSVGTPPLGYCFIKKKT